MEICCWKERNRPERIKATTVSKAGSEIRDRSHGDMLLEREEWAERAKVITGGKAAWKETQIWQNAAGQGRGLHEASGSWEVFIRGKRGSRG
jgi:hypothetical protein